MQFMDIKNGRFYLGDCLEVMKEIPDGVIDMILTDPPYGTTACAWDSIIPLEPMWEQLKRVIKPNGAIVMTASQPFTSTLVASNMKMFKYCWVWEKSRSVGFLNARNAPLKRHEDIVVFSDGATANGSKRNMPYHPQGLVEIQSSRESVRQSSGTVVGSRPSRQKPYIATRKGFPSSIIRINNEAKQIHPTQKPVALMEYLIKTYTNEGEIVLDFTAGSGTTAIAAENTGRKWVCIEQSEEYATKAVERIVNHEMTLQEKPTSEVQIDSNIPIPEGGENGN